MDQGTNPGNNRFQRPGGDPSGNPGSNPGRSQRQRPGGNPGNPGNDWDDF
jgi:hypothetical protein